MPTIEDDHISWEGAFGGGERLVVSHPAIRPLAKWTLSELGPYDRMLGYKKGELTGLRIPEALIFIGHEIYEELVAGKGNFTPQTESLLLTWAQTVIDTYGAVTVRRCHAIPDIPQAGSRRALGVTDARLAVQAVKDIFAEAQTLISAYHDRSSDGSQALAGAWFQRHIDPEDVFLSQIYRPEYRGDLPRSVHAQVAAVDQVTGDLWIMVRTGFGQSNGLLGGDCDWYLYKVSQEGAITLLPRQYKQGLKREMLAITDLSRGNPEFPDGDHWIPVPEQFILQPVIDGMSMMEIVCALHRLYYPEDGNAGKAHRLEAQYGFLPDMQRKAFYITEIVPQEPEEDYFKRVELFGRVVTVDSQGDWYRVLQALKGPDPVLVYLPPRVVRDRDNELLDYVMDEIKGLGHRDPGRFKRLKVVHASESGTGHQYKTLVELRQAWKREFGWDLDFIAIGKRRLYDGSLVAIVKEGLSLQVTRSADEMVIDVSEAGDVTRLELGGKLVDLARAAEEYDWKIARGGGITASAFNLILKELGLDEKVARLKSTRSKKEALALAREIRSGLNKIPKSILETIKTLLIKTFRSNLPERVIVRSCALLEDGNDDSFAGEFETTDTTFENLEEGLLTVYRSLFSASVINRIFSHNEGPRLKAALAGLSMSVIVQEYYDLEKIGGYGLVVFTKDEHAPHLAKIDVVQGQPVRNIVDGEETIALLFDQKKNVLYKRVRRGKKQTATIPLSVEEMADFAIPLHELALIMHRAEEYFGDGAGADIELAYIPGNDFIFFQLRQHNI